MGMKFGANVEGLLSSRPQDSFKAEYNFKTKVTKGKLTYTYDLTTLDVIHNFNSNATQLDITRKLDNKDSLKLTTYSGSKETALQYKRNPFKMTLKVPASADKVSGQVVFEKDYLW